ncbi:PAS domain S-box protein [Halosolutus halophilus]|uniref:PAS domain S-box protein n=1 Tax=Halosolutus halophilus TaxID=1552990 RepID=UPI0022351752|nr:PAS domain S-box protein [Halosolutus halophilus]
MSDTMARWPVRTGAPSRSLWLVAIGVAVAVVASQWIGFEPLGVSGLPLDGLELIGIVGLTRQDESEGPIADLTTAVERLAAGEDDVDFSTDRSGEIGRLSEAIADLASTLREREQQLDLQRTYADDLLDGVADVFCVVDRDGSLRHWNGTLSRVTGSADDALESMPIAEFVPDDERDRLDDAVETGIETGSARVEVPIETSDGTSVPYEFVVHGLADPDETPVAAITGRDVTDRAEREREITETEAARRELSRIMSDTSLSRTAKIDRLLELGCDRFGVDNGFTTRIDDATGRCRVETAVGPGFVEEGFEMELSKTFCRRTIDTDDTLGISHATEEGYADDPAHREWGISCYLGGQIRVDGERYGTLGFLDREPREEPFSRAEKTFADLLTRWVSHVYEHREHDRELRRTDRAMEAAPIGITMTDPTQPDNPIVYANDAFERITGYSSDEYLGRNCRFLQGEGTDPKAVDRLHAAVDAEEPASAKLRNYRKDGTPFWNHVNIAPVKNDADEVTHFVGFQQDVTERTEAERQLRERERRLEQYRTYTDDVLDAIDDVFYVLDGNGHVQRWNETLLEATGYSADEVESMHATDFFAEADQERVVDAIETVRETGSDRIELPYLTADGESIPYEFTASLLEDPEGNPVVVGIGRDVSDRKEKERKLHEREQQLEQYREYTDDVLNALDDIFFVIDGAGYLQRWNDQFGEAMGYSDAELSSMHAVEFFADEDREAIASAIAEAHQSGSTRIECDAFTSDGEPVPYEFVASGLEDPEGDPVIAGIARDISDRKARERELREHERQLSTLMSNIPGMVYRCRNDPDWPFEFVSEGCSELTGYDPESLVDGDVNWAADVLLDGQDDLWETVQQALANREPFRVTYPIETADGERRWMSEQGRAMYADDGSFECLEGVIIDITDRIESERELERTRQLLTQAQQLANVGAWELDLTGNAAELEWSDEVARIHGVSTDADVDSGDALEFYVPADRDRLERALDRAVESGESYELELRLVRTDGEQRWVRTIGDPVTEDGEIVAVRGSIQDITDHKERERELERYETIVQALGDPVYTLDEEGYFRFVNDAIESLTGYEPADLVGEHVSTVMTQPDLGNARELVRDLLRTDTPYGTFEMALPTNDGDSIETENHVALLPTDDGSFAGTAGVVRDITDRKEREREVERTTELLEQAQQIAGVGGWELDVTTEPYDLTVTTELNRLFGDPPGTETDLREALGRYHPDDRQRVVSAIERTIEDGEGYDLEVRMYRADGTVRWMRTMAQPVFEDAEGRRSTGDGIASDDGEIVAVRGSIQDITDRKEREHELERTTDLLERVQRLAEVGGWEMDVQADRRTETWTEELYRLHDVPRHVTPDVELAIEGYHPDDRAFVRDQIETAIATEREYDFEARLQTDAGESRWVRAIGEPIYDGDGNLLKYRGSVQDISDRKRRELALESLHETARGLLQAESESAVADLVVETAAEVLDVHGVGVYLLDADANAFEPAAYTDGFAEVCGGTPPVPLGDDDSALWNTFVTDTQTVFDDVSVVDRSPLFGSDVPGGLLVPIGDYGVFVFVAPPSTIDDETRRLVETLVATTEAAFDRLESEASLRERDVELEAQNRRLKRQIGINEIIRSIDQSLVRTTERAEVERTVCERLVDTEDIAFAWIGSVDASETAIEPRAWDGDGEAYLDAVSLSTDADQPEPAVRAALAEESTVVSNVVAELQSEPWRKTALASDFASCLCVPISFDEYSYGVLAVYGTEPDTFGDLERTVFEELGENIANSITAVQTRHALHADTLLELTLRFDDSDAFLARIARETDAIVEYEGVATHSADETRLFFTTDGSEPDAVETVLDDLVTVIDWRLVSDADDRCLFEATVTGTELVSRLLRHGASPRSITATGSEFEVVVDVSPSTDVREFVQMLAQGYPSVELAGRHDVERAMHTRGELVSSLFEPLTDRQLEVLRTAYFAGFFEWPRTSTGEEVATMLDVSQPTVNRHLRVGQKRLLAGLFGSEGHSIVGDQEAA